MHIIKFLYKSSIFIFLSIIIIIISLYTNAYLSSSIKLNTTSSYKIYDNKNELIYNGNNQSEWTDIENITDNFINAVISIEDKNFYKHNGFDIARIVKALIKNLTKGKIIEGASTISQQYIKNAYLDFDKTWTRKIKEAKLTLNLETHYSKNEILEAYLNTINYGNGNYGITSAAKYYFNKTPKDLSLEESIILAGIPKNPTKYNPINNYDEAIKRAKVVAKAMLNNNVISTDEYNKLFKDKIEIYENENDTNLKMLNYYTDTVLNELKTIKGISDEQINTGNIKIYTTLDLETQTSMEKNINNYIDDPDLQIASIIINPNTGEILALTGGIDYTKSQYNRALKAKRQVGSTMKPFLYYAGLSNGMTSSSTFLSQYTTFNLDNNNTYSPKNYANKYANKNITMAAAIAYSDNIYAVKTNLFLGTNQLINTAKTCGIKEKLKNVPSLALGTSEINLLDFAQGYSTLASGGYKRDLYTISRIEDENGNLLYEHDNYYDLVLNPNYVYILNELLTSTTNSNFIDYNNPTAINIASKLKGKYAIKTGTTDTDYLTVGYNKDVLMLIWNGYDDNKNISVSIGSKSKNIWADTIENININEHTWYDMPENVVGIALDSITGNVSYEENKSNIFYYLKGSEPTYK